MGDHLRYLFKGLLAILLILNIILIFNYLLDKKKNKRLTTANYGNLLLNSGDLKTRENHYDSYCPDIAIRTSLGETINLRSLAGQVIVFKFTGFYQDEMPELIYLDHLGDYYKKAGVNLIFVYLQRRSGPPSYERRPGFIAPVVNDDGFISSQFNASLGDAVIVGKDFKIKFKYDNISNDIVYDQLIRNLLNGDSPRIKDENGQELADLIGRIIYKDILTGEIENIRKESQDRAVIIDSFVTTCFVCPEKTRLSMLKELSEAHTTDDRVLIIILFGHGNNEESIIQYMNNWELRGRNIRVGIVQFPSRDQKEEYYSLFRLDYEDRLMILDRDESVTYIERHGDAVDKSFINTKIGRI